MRGYRAGRARELNQDNRAAPRCALDTHRTTVILNDLAHNGEAETGSVGLAGAHEWVKYRVADDIWDAAAFIDHADFKRILAALYIDGNPAVVAVRSGFACIQNQVEKNALELLGVEDAFRAFMAD